jgi:DNA recombination protein RmuC
MKGEIKGIFTEIEKSRDRSEDKRDAKLQDMSNTIDSFNRTISGTKTRGMVGESILKEALKNSIKAGVVKTELKIGSKNVEFAWDLGDGKYIPIDSKLPDIVPLVSQYENSKNTEEQKLLSKKIKDKVAKEILNIQKYQNQTNTIDNCILVIPPSILDMSPELVGIGKDSNVFVCSYKDVFPIAHILEEQYRRFNEEGDIGEYKKTIKQLDSILDKVISKTETLDRAIKQISNANDEIKDEVAKGKRL